MSGVLFVICIPRERYEKCLDNSIRITQDDLKNQQQQQGTISSNSSDTSLKIARRNLNEYNTANIPNESDTENVDINNPIRKQNQQEDEEPFVQGSLDSEKFKRTIEKRQEDREREEAVEKFYSTPTQKVLDKMLTPMEQVVREIINRMQIINASWKKINNANCYKISFCIEKGARCDETIHLLSEYGIGQKKGSSIAVVPCTYYENILRTKDKDRESSVDLKETAWSRFVGTMRARLNVAKIVEVVKSDASLTFDFFLLLVVAAVLASFGLIENNTLFLTASMLISPLMGPIMAATFGAAIKDHKLQYLGLKNEIVGISLCIFVGFIFGMVICGVDYMFGDTKTLTHEILSRCNIHSVIVGIFIALPSGAANSIALLRENFGSLAGVAISASLLPPAVNTGILWSFSCLTKIFENTGKFDSFIEKKDGQDQALELLIYGFVSLLVTLTNVFSVYIMGYIFLRLKIQVGTLRNDEERQFWKHDVPIAREANVEEANKLTDEMNQFGENERENFKGVGRELLRKDFYRRPAHTWSPVNYRYLDLANFDDFDTLYKTMNKVDDKHSKGNYKKKSDPIATSKSKPSTSHEIHKFGSDDSNIINRHTTFINILSSSTDDNDIESDQKHLKRIFSGKSYNV